MGSISAASLVKTRQQRVVKLLLQFARTYRNVSIRRGLEDALWAETPNWYGLSAVMQSGCWP